MDDESGEFMERAELVSVGRSQSSYKLMCELLISNTKTTLLWAKA